MPPGWLSAARRVPSAEQAMDNQPELVEPELGAPVGVHVTPLSEEV